MYWEVNSFCIQSYKVEWKGQELVRDRVLRWWTEWRATTWNEKNLMIEKTGRALRRERKSRNLPVSYMLDASFWHSNVVTVVHVCLWCHLACNVHAGFFILPTSFHTVSQLYCTSVVRLLQWNSARYILIALNAYIICHLTVMFLHYLTLLKNRKIMLFSSQ